MTEKFLSIIICTYNRAMLLEKCLESLMAQTAGLFTHEVLVVDGSSNDETQSLVHCYAEKEPSIRYIFEEKPGHSNARNRGYEEAVGVYLIYLDDDAIVPVDYLENVLRVISGHSPDIVGGPVYPYYISAKPRWFRDEFEIRKYAEQSGFSKTCGISGGNFIVKKDILAELGLFDPDYGMIGGKLGMLDEAKTLAQYRLLTPLEDQKVYYSLECYIKHYTPAEKMRLSYMIKRRYVTGLMAFQMYLELHGRPDYRQGIRLLGRIPITGAKFIRDIVKKGILGADYSRFFIGILMTTVWSYGYLLSQTQYFIKTKLLRRK